MSPVIKSVLRLAHTRSQIVRRTPRAIRLTPTSIRCLSASGTPGICQKPPLEMQAAALSMRGTDPLRSHVGFGSAKRLPEFGLQNKVVLISGGVGGVGLHQSEALMEAGATGRSKSIYLLVG